MRMIKSAEEIELIRTSAHFGNVAHAALQDHLQPGLTELEVCVRPAASEAASYVARAFGEELGADRRIPRNDRLHLGTENRVSQPSPGGRAQAAPRGRGAHRRQPGSRGLLQRVGTDDHHGPADRLQRQAVLRTEVQAQDVAIAAILAGGTVQRRRARR